MTNREPLLNDPAFSAPDSAPPPVPRFVYLPEDEGLPVIKQPVSWQPLNARALRRLVLTWIVTPFVVGFAVMAVVCAAVFLRHGPLAVLAMLAAMGIGR